MYHQAQFGGDCNVCREGAREVKRRLRTARQEEVEDVEETSVVYPAVPSKCGISRGFARRACLVGPSGM